MKSEHIFSPAEILLPSPEQIARGNWACIACDQFTSEPAYWEAAAAQVGDAISTLSLMLPEVYLAEADTRLPRYSRLHGHLPHRSRRWH